jgi:hypothetical protein
MDRVISGKIKTIASIILLAILVCAVYVPVWSNGFVNLDDPLYITEKPMVCLERGSGCGSAVFGPDSPSGSFLARQPDVLPAHDRGNGE